MAEQPPAQPPQGHARADMVWALFRLSGRLSRKPFILGWLFLTAINGMFLGQVIGFQEADGQPGAFWSLMFLTCVAISFWASMALSIKRLHDMGYPGALAICLVVPAISIIALLAFCVWPGTAGPNTYGERTNEP
jgi:uncharacterized membrane protein YhaH (DUF805 family)